MKVEFASWGVAGVLGARGQPTHHKLNHQSLRLRVAACSQSEAGRLIAPS